MLDVTHNDVERSKGKYKELINSIHLKQRDRESAQSDSKMQCRHDRSLSMPIRKSPVNLKVTSSFRGINMFNTPKCKKSTSSSLIPPSEWVHISLKKNSLNRSIFIPKKRYLNSTFSSTTLKRSVLASKGSMVKKAELYSSAVLEIIKNSNLDLEPRNYKNHITFASSKKPIKRDFNRFRNEWKRLDKLSKLQALERNIELGVRDQRQSFL